MHVLIFCKYLEYKCLNLYVYNDWIIYSKQSFRHTSSFFVTVFNTPSVYIFMIEFHRYIFFLCKLKTRMNIQLLRVFCLNYFLKSFCKLGFVHVEHQQIHSILVLRLSSTLPSTILNFSHFYPFSLKSLDQFYST